MTKENLFPAWGILFIICAGLGFIPEPQGGARVLLTILSLLFFVPPAIILYRARKTGDLKTAARIRFLSAASLAVTLLLIILTILNAMRTDGFTVFLNAALTILSAPMITSGYWALSLFLWACLLVGSFQKK